MGGIARVQCQDYQKGVMVFWKEEACVAMPFESGNKACREEREVLRRLGAENAAKMRATDPDWWKTPYLNTYAYGDVRRRTEELGITARIWAGGTYWGWRDDEIYMAHATGIRTIPSHSFVKAGDLNGFQEALIKAEGIVIRGPQDLRKPEYVRIKTDLAYLKERSAEYRRIASAEARDLDGRTVATDRCDHPLAPPRAQCQSAHTIYMDPTVSAFRQHLIEWFKAQIDAGADGVHIDDTNGLDVARAFNADTMARFRQWLAARPELVARAGIRDVATFDYRAFLLGRGYTAATLKALDMRTEEWRAVPLMVEFRTFYNAERELALTEIVTAVRAYSKEKGRTGFVITGNVGGLAASGAFLVGPFDMFSFEHAYMVGDDPLRYGSIVPLAKLGPAKGVPLTNEQVMGEPAQASIMARVPEPLRSDLIRLQIMESSAAHTAAHFIRDMQLPVKTQTTDEDANYLAMEDRAGLTEVKRAVGFIQRYRDTYRAVAQSPARIALVYDNDEVAREWREDLRARHQGAVEEAARALWAKNVEFDIVSWTQLMARSYPVVVLAPSRRVSAERASLVGSLRAAGTKVYALWDAPSGIAVDGRVSGDDVARIGAAAAPPLALPPGMGSLRYVDGKGGTIVHLMNYDYDASGFKVKKDVRVDPGSLDGATSVTFASLEHPDPIVLDPKDPRVPQLTTYGLLIAKR